MPVDPSSLSNDITPTLLPSSSSSSSLQTDKLTITRVPVQSTMSSTIRTRSDVEQLDDLVKDLLSEVNQTDIRTPSPPSVRVSSSNGTGIRIKPGPTMNIPSHKTSNQSMAMAASLDEQLIDSLLESVQNTLRKRAMHQQIPTSRRAHSSSSAYTDSIHRMDPQRYRYPIKLYRSDSPASTISSRRPSSRTDIGGYPSGQYYHHPHQQQPHHHHHHHHHRATSEPPPEGPIQLQRMDLIRTPSRTYFDPPEYPYPYYPPPPPPPPPPAPPGYYRTSRPRYYYDQSGYESDITRVYPSRPMFRSDGYETDSGLISSGRIRMARTLPSASSTSRMAVIPENNRMYPRREKKYANEFDHEVPIQRDLRTRSVDVEQSRIQRETDTVIPITTEDEKQAPPVTIDVPITKASTTTSTSIDQHIYKNVDQTVSSPTRTEMSTIQTQDEISQRSSLSSTTPDVDANRVGIFQAHNVSRFWYKEKMSRDDAINILKHQSPGTFLVRDSQGFPGSFGLAVKVATLPPGIQTKANADPNAELVRHYLIERTPTGHVRLKGCPNEPDFASLSALVYHHTIASLALPIKLVLPSNDIAENYRPTTNTNTTNQTKKMNSKELLSKGAACHVVYLNNVDVGSLTGQMAVAKALESTFDHPEQLQTTIVQFKVSNDGITLNDSKKKIFSHHHFPKEHVTYCGLDYDNDRFWTYQYPDLKMLNKAKCFGFVAKKMKESDSSSEENKCHIFAELDPLQPANAIVNFVSKVMIGSVPV